MDFATFENCLMAILTTRESFIVIVVHLNDNGSRTDAQMGHYRLILRWKEVSFQAHPVLEKTET